ncbi:MAG: hypothetical protein WCY27_03095 [archaeon]|jgi:ERCC4-related helicase|nr:hypothetical protein [archaeon]MDD2477769.1 hypothetical protein [Candidatus ainarchaeum sp.]MDD3084859.1 hypothetical protein [Candidatus ainarchaeum sp.]MDD4221193.1 hypothetical protein [Candidatus ainarchaeum sp.]MDD4662855.1 hypothetical protein [Candidatus ainarchaeum sp.]
MANFLGVLSIGKGTWGQVAHIIDNSEYENVFLVSNEWAQDKFTCTKKVNWIIIDPRKGFSEILEDISKQWSEKLEDLELNLHSGSGKEHSAILAILKQKKINYKIVTINADGIVKY